MHKISLIIGMIGHMSCSWAMEIPLQQLAEQLQELANVVAKIDIKSKIDNLRDRLKIILRKETRLDEVNRQEIENNLDEMFSLEYINQLSETAKIDSLKRIENVVDAEQWFINLLNNRIKANDAALFESFRIIQDKQQALRSKPNLNSLN